MKEKEVILIGDINVDMQAMNLENNEKTNTQKQQNPLMKLIHKNLINNNLKLINNKTTFTRGEHKSQLDAIFTNKPQKVIEIKQYENIESDHQLLSCNRVMNIQCAEERYIKIRNFTNINTTEWNIEILAHNLYEDTLNSINTEIISENINKIINEVFNKVAPEKKSNVIKTKKWLKQKN